eukprot:scaffold16340_cov126-Isochrysis_galbana.AAC.2
MLLLAVRTALHGPLGNRAVLQGIVRRGGGIRVPAHCGCVLDRFRLQLEAIQGPPGSEDRRRAEVVARVAGRAELPDVQDTLGCPLLPQPGPGATAQPVLRRTLGSWEHGRVRACVPLADAARQAQWHRVSAVYCGSSACGPRAGGRTAESGHVH